MNNEKLTCISEITGLPMLAALKESCGESACADVCEDFGEKGCVGCPVQAAISKLYEIEHPQPLTLEQLRERVGKPVWVATMGEWRMVITAHDGINVNLYTVYNTISARAVYDNDGRIYDYPPKDVTL